MSSRSETFRDMLQGVVDSSPEAVRAFVQQYQDVIRWAVRRRLGPQMRSHFDSEDFVQMVWGSFFRTVSKSPEIHNEVELRKLFYIMVRNKIAAEWRRSRSREVNGLEIDPHPRHEPDAPHDRCSTPNEAKNFIDAITPSRHAIARERLERLLSELSQRNRQIVQMRMLGASYSEIAGRLEIGESTAREVVLRVIGERHERRPDE